MKSRLKKAKNKLWLNRVAVAAMGGVVGLLYTLGVTVKPGWLTYAIQLPALIIIALTALARVNDIREDRVTWHWQARRLFLSMAGTAGVAFIFAPFGDGEFPTWRGLLVAWGVAGTWLTTPGMPPWSEYIFGKATPPKELT